MCAMEMMFSVKSPDLSKDLHPGDVVDFKIEDVVDMLERAPQPLRPVARLDHDVKADERDVAL